MFSVQAAAVAGGAALLLSLITGMISGVGFGLVLIRSLISGGVFFGLTAGGEYILRTFLPELFEESRKADTESPRKTEDQQVDIILDDDNDDEPAQSVEEAENESGPAETVSEAEPMQEFEAADPEEDDFVEEVGAVEPAEDADEVEEEREEFENIDTDSVEELPSLDSFSDSFESVGSADDDSGPVTSQRDMNVDVLGENQNVEDVARAVQTILKKDSEG